MSVSSIKSLSAMATSVAVALALVACQQGTLTSSVKRDGSLEFVATGQVTQSNVTGGIAVDSYQGLAIDPTGMAEGSMHIQVVDMDGAATADTAAEDSGVAPADDAAANDGTKNQGTAGAGDASRPEAEEANKENGVSGAEDTQGTRKGFSGETISGEAISGTIPTASDDVTPQDGTTVFSRTFSAMDVVDGDEDGIVTVTDIPSGYYVVFVSADHATGTIKVRSYDLTDEELADRETKAAMDKVKGWFKDLGLLSDETAPTSK